MNETLTSDHNINIFAIKISNDFQLNNFLQFFHLPVRKDTIIAKNRTRYTIKFRREYIF